MLLFLLLRAVPGLLGSEARFKRDFSDPVEHGQRHNATKRELATGRKAMKRLAQKMSGYFLRRTKALIHNQLPKKEDRVRTIICNKLSTFVNTSMHLSVQPTSWMPQHKNLLFRMHYHTNVLHKTCHSTLHAVISQYTAVYQHSNLF